jgi:hypothetical protein
VGGGRELTAFGSTVTRVTDHARIVCKIAAAVRDSPAP